MSTTAKLFRSDYGYISPYFVADVNGNVIANTLTLTGSRLELTAGSYISYNGSPLVTNTSLASTITSIPGTLTGLTVNGAVSITGSLSAVNGSITFNPSSTGSLDNIAIGATTPKAGTFTDLAATTSVNFNVPGAITISPSGGLTLGKTGVTTTLYGVINMPDGGSINIAPTAGTVTISSSSLGSMDNMSVGLTTPASAQFTNATITAIDARWNSNRSQIATKRYAENTGLALVYFGMGQ
jgi:hypothetical protein